MLAAHVNAFTVLLFRDIKLEVCLDSATLWFSYLKFADHGEGLQILHYEVGQKYEPHYDYFLDEFNTQNGGQRIATLLMYL